MSITTTADALLLVSTQCPHCASVMKSLSELVKQGDIAALEIINLEQKPEIADKYSVRSVPWIKIGWFELEGLHSQKELLDRARQAASDEGALAYLSEELLDGRVNKVLSLLESQHDLMKHILTLLADGDAKINIRLGIGVLMEEFAAADWFAPFIAQLAQLAQHNDERVRADVCHYLSLTEHKTAIAVITKLLNDDSEEVRDVASESLEELREAGVIDADQ